MATARVGAPFALVLITTLVGTTWAQQPKPEPPRIRRIELTAGSFAKPLEVRIRPGLATTLLFDSNIVREQMELEGRERFDRIVLDEGTLVLLPSSALHEGERLRLTVTFTEETPPKTTGLVLVVNSAQADGQVEVRHVAPPLEPATDALEQARAEVERLRDAHARLQAECGPGGLSGLIAAGALDERGVSVQTFYRVPGNTAVAPLGIKEARSFRAAHRVAVVVFLARAGAALAGTAARANILGTGDQRLRVIHVSQHPPTSEFPDARVIVEIDATRDDARSVYTLELQDAEGNHLLTVPGVRFP